MSQTNTKKIYDSNIFSGIGIPIAIVLGGALIVFGITKMLSSDRSYKDLVGEMKSKTFGNRWVAAYELSKVLNHSQVPEEEIPELVGELQQIYQSTDDPRTKQFIIAAAATIKGPITSDLLKIALTAGDASAKFHAVVGFSRYSKNDLPSVPTNELINILNADDEVLAQSAALALATFEIPEAQEHLVSKLSQAPLGLRFSSALALIAYRNEKALPLLKQIMGDDLANDQEFKKRFQAKQILDLKLNILSSIEKYQWTFAYDIVKEAASDKSSNEVLKTRAQQILHESTQSH